MRNQACDPCAKRKVRCDRADPTCSNCKRRKKDHCVYPEPGSDERIKRLEAIVQNLGGAALLKQSPETPATNEPAPTPSSALSHGSSVERSVDHSVYLESQGWQSWINVTRGHGDGSSFGPTAAAHQSAKNLPHAFSASPIALHVSNPTSDSGLPFPASEARKLWDAFRERVEPIIRLSFPWTLARLQSSMNNSAVFNELNLGERALAITSCYFGVVSLAKAECLADFGTSKVEMLSIFRRHSEEAIMRTNLLAINDIESLKAICLYVKASVDAVSNQSLWSLMGLASRSAELLGIHRDGELLGLGAIETEERRRLWWQIQHIDLIMAVKNGSTPLTFMADWDSKLPTSIEDDDLMKDGPLPEEQPGVNSFSYTFFTCWIMNQQRQFRQKHQGTVERSLLGPLTDSFINELESGLQTRFLQYCDPTNPIDTLLQLASRAVICALRLRRMHATRLMSKDMDDAFFTQYLDLCVRELGYTVAAFTQPSLKIFQWMGELSMMWHALITLLVDLPHLADANRTRKAWKLLDDLYASAEFLTDFGVDKRRLRAAELVIAAWKACASKPMLAGKPTPEWIVKLEGKVLNAASEEAMLESGDTAEHAAPMSDEDQTFSDLLGVEFADIEWSFWQ